MIGSRVAKVLRERYAPEFFILKHPTYSAYALPWMSDRFLGCNSQFLERSVSYYTDQQRVRADVCKRGDFRCLYAFLRHLGRLNTQHRYRGYMPIQFGC